MSFDYYQCCHLDSKHDSINYHNHFIVQLEGHTAHSKQGILLVRKLTSKSSCHPFIPVNSLSMSKFPTHLSSCIISNAREPSHLFHSGLVINHEKADVDFRIFTRTRSITHNSFLPSFHLNLLLLLLESDRTRIIAIGFIRTTLVSL